MQETQETGGERGMTPGSGISLGGRNGKHSSILAWKNPMDRGAWWATGHGVAESWTQLSTSVRIEHATPSSVNPNVNHGLWVIIMCQCVSIDCNKCTAQLGSVDNGGSYVQVGAGEPP